MATDLSNSCAADETLSILLYPGNQKEKIYYKKFILPNHSCGIFKINVIGDDRKLDVNIGSNMMQAF